MKHERLGRTGWSVSPIGFGSYRVDDRTPAHREALTKALSSGVNLIDTSSNYTDGSSESLIGSVVEDLVSQGKVRREDLVIVTKAGYVQGANLELAKLRIEQKKPFPEMVKFDSDCWHCISPEFLSTQIQRSLSRMRADRLDALLLHNPEYFLKTHSDHAEYYRRIRNAFEFLETEVTRGTISWYGVSSNTFGDPKESPHFTSLEVLLDIACEISPDHHFAIIELPLNLFEPGGALEKNNSGKTVLELARENELGVLVNRPLNAFHENSLVRLADFPDSSQGRDLESELREAFTHLMQLESSHPAAAEASSTRLYWGHIIRKNFATISSIDSWTQILTYQIEPALTAALAELSANPETVPWADEYRFRATELFEAVTAYVEFAAAARSREISTMLDALTPELAGSPRLSQKVIRVYRSLPGLNCVLVGMRKSQYVDDVLRAAEASPLTQEQALSLLTEINQTQ